MAAIDSPDPNGGRGLVESVLRATRLLDCFQPGRPEMAMAEFVRNCGYSKTTTYRLLNTLVAAGWLERGSTGGFRLTIKPFQLGSILVDSLDVRREALPVMAELATAFGGTVYLTVPRQGVAVCLERLDAGGAVRVMDLDVGGSQPMHLGAGPRVLLAFRESEFLGPLLAAGLETRTDASITDPMELREDLARSRSRGYSISRGDVTPGVGAVGAPVFDAGGEAIAAISVGYLLDGVTPVREGEIAGRLVQACRELSTRLGLPGGISSAGTDGPQGQS